MQNKNTHYFDVDVYLTFTITTVFMYIDVIHIKYMRKAIFLARKFVAT